MNSETVLADSHIIRHMGKGKLFPSIPNRSADLKLEGSSFSSFNTSKPKTMKSVGGNSATAKCLIETCKSEVIGHEKVKNVEQQKSNDQIDLIKLFSGLTVNSSATCLADKSVDEEELQERGHSDSSKKSEVRHSPYNIKLNHNFIHLSGGLSFVEKPISLKNNVISGNTLSGLPTSVNFSLPLSPESGYDTERSENSFSPSNSHSDILQGTKQKLDSEDEEFLDKLICKMPDVHVEEQERYWEDINEVIRSDSNELSLSEQSKNCTDFHLPLQQIECQRQSPVEQTVNVHERCRFSPLELNENFKNLYSPLHQNDSPNLLCMKQTANADKCNKSLPLELNTDFNIHHMTLQHKKSTDFHLPLQLGECQRKSPVEQIVNVNEHCKFSPFELNENFSDLYSPLHQNDIPSLLCMKQSIDGDKYNKSLSLEFSTDFNIHHMALQQKKSTDFHFQLQQSECQRKSPVEQTVSVNEHCRFSSLELNEIFKDLHSPLYQNDCPKILSTGHTVNVDKYNKSLPVELSAGFNVHHTILQQNKNDSDKSLPLEQILNLNEYGKSLTLKESINVQDCHMPLQQSKYHKPLLVEQIANLKECPKDITLKKSLKDFCTTLQQSQCYTSVPVEQARISNKCFTSLPVAQMNNTKGVVLVPVKLENTSTPKYRPILPKPPVNEKVPMESNAFKNDVNKPARKQLQEKLNQDIKNEWARKIYDSHTDSKKPVIFIENEEYHRTYTPTDAE